MTVESQMSGKTILLVDDEQIIRKTSKRLLSRLGFDVLLAESGERAIEMYKDHQERIALILLDLIMPEMSGRDTFELLRNLDPKVKIMVSSGYCHNEGIDNLLKNGAVGFVKKPYDLRELSEKMQQAIA